MAYSNSDLEIAALKYLQAKIIRYLKLIYNKNFNKIKSRKYIKNLMDKIKNLSDQIYYNISQLVMLPLDNLEINEIKLINNLIDKIKNLSDQIHDDISQIQPVDLGNSGINYGELQAYISQNEDLKYFQQVIQEIHIEIMHIHDLLESEMIIEVEDIFFPDGSILLVQIYFWKMTLELGSFSLMKYVFRKIGLPYPNWILPTSTFQGHIFLNILKDAYEQNLTVDEMFINKLMVQSRIQDTLDSWKTKNNSNIQKRIPILEEAVAAHLDGKFYLSVSALIPQIEGLLRDAINSSDIITKHEIDSLKSNQMKSATESLKKEWEKQNQQEDWLLLLTNLPQVISNLYQKYESAEALDHGLYRHGICHGLQTDFGVDKNSLRLILIIDRIIFFMEDN